eukprot:scaffold5812_cov140-Isochrysis_galbana.AAC.3
METGSTGPVGHSTVHKCGVSHLQTGQRNSTKFNSHHPASLALKAGPPAHPHTAPLCQPDSAAAAAAEAAASVAACASSSACATVATSTAESVSNSVSNSAAATIVATSSDPLAVVSASAHGATILLCTQQVTRPSTASRRSGLDKHIKAARMFCRGPHAMPIASGTTENELLPVKSTDGSQKTSERKMRAKKIVIDLA